MGVYQPSLVFLDYCHALVDQDQHQLVQHVLILQHRRLHMEATGFVVPNQLFQVHAQVMGSKGALVCRPIAHHIPELPFVGRVTYGQVNRAEALTAQVDIVPEDSRVRRRGELPHLAPPLAPFVH